MTPLECKRKHCAALRKRANVVGVGTGLARKAGAQTDEPAVIVLVSQKLPSHRVAAADMVPKILDGIRVDVV